jgi:gliding motility-associated-like protein
VAKVDLRLNNGLGDVVPNSLQLLRKKVAPGMAAMLHANNRDTWIVTQNGANDSLYVNLISPAGIAAPISSLTNNPRIDPRLGNGRMKSSPNSQMIVTAGASPGEIKLYSFNRSLGTVSGLHTLPLANPARGSFTYAFSPDNTKLYAGVWSNQVGKSYIYQYNLGAGSTQQIQQSVYIMPVPTDASLVIDMQLAIDGKVYVSRGDTVMYLSRINCPNLTGAAFGFELRAAKLLGGTYAQVVLPTLNQTIFRNADILQAQAQQDTICYGDSVKLLAYGAGADRFRWQPANGLNSLSDTLANPTVSPTTTTTYTVIGSGVCQTTLSASVTVTVLPKPGNILISGPTSVCPQLQNVWYKAFNTRKQKISWGIKGGTIATFTNDSVQVNWGNSNPSGKIWAVAKNRLGCPGDTAFLPVNISTVLLTEKPKGADTLCLAAANNINYQVTKTTGSVYTWGINGGSIQKGQGTTAVSVNWTKAGIGKLWVKEASQTSTTNCFGSSDTLQILIKPSPTDLLVKGPVQVFTYSENQEYLVQEMGSGSNFIWQVTGGKLEKGQGQNRIWVNWQATGNGFVSVKETNLVGCEGNEAILQVQIAGKPLPIFPNIFTPNHDNLNEVFEIGNMKWYPENELKIYNRWGAEIYQTKNYQNNWKAENVSSGIYYYFFRTSTGQSWKGWVEVAK